MARLYDITSREVDPLSDLLKAIVEVNYHLDRARDASWLVDLGVDREWGRLTVEVKRFDGWPNPTTEADEASS